MKKSSEKLKHRLIQLLGSNLSKKERRQRDKLMLKLMRRDSA